MQASTRSSTRSGRVCAWTGSETPFAPRVGATDEDDGYLVSFVTDMRRDRSACVVLDARDVEAPLRDGVELRHVAHEQRLQREGGDEG